MHPTGDMPHEMAAACRAKVALQKLNTDVVHGVSSGNLDVDAIALDNRDVQAALGGAMAAGTCCMCPSCFPFPYVIAALKLSWQQAGFPSVIL